MAVMSKQNPSLYKRSQKLHTEPKEYANSVKCESDVYSFLGVNVLFTMNLLLRDQTINKEKKYLREAVRRQMPNSWRNRKWIFEIQRTVHHDIVLQQ